jgi:hypothetical protein
VSFDKVRDVSTCHSFRDDRKKRRRQRDTDERQDVLVLKPLPSNDLFDEELRVQYERSL